MINSDKELKASEKKIRENKKEIKNLKKEILEYNNINNVKYFEKDCKDFRSHIYSNCPDGTLVRLGEVTYKVGGVDYMIGEYGMDSIMDAVFSGPFEDLLEGESVGILHEKQ